MPREEFEIFNSDRKPFSLLSGQAIENIAKLIEDLAKISSCKITKRLALLMTVTNLQGLLLNNPDGKDKSISSAEIRKFFFYPGLEEEQEFESIWNKVIISSLASGAFPVAFPPRKDSSAPSSENFPDLGLSDDYFEDPQNQILNDDLPIVVKEENKLKLEFSYSDGGILDNLPILKGIEIEDDLKENSSYLFSNVHYQKFKDYSKSPISSDDSSLESSEERYHVYVKPNPAVNLKSSNRLLKTSFTLWETAISGLRLPHEEHETIQIKEIQEIQKLTELKNSLLEHLNDNLELKEKLNKAIPYQQINLSPITPLIIDKIAKDDLEELKLIYDVLKDFSPMINEGLGAGGNSLDPTKILASDFLGAFGGFFDRKYREHDFLIGRICGVTWLYSELKLQIPQATINSLIQEIPQTILREEPKLKPSYIVRLFRIFLRFIRITILELEPKGIWNLVYYPLLVIAILVLRSLELIATIILWVVKDVLKK